MKQLVAAGDVVVEPDTRYAWDFEMTPLDVDSTKTVTRWDSSRSIHVIERTTRAGITYVIHERTDKRTGRTYRSFRAYKPVARDSAKESDHE